MQTKNVPSVLPLHLTPIDAYFLTDDSPRYPMTSVIQLRFTGQMDAGAFASALQVASQRHPLTAAVVRPAKRNQPCWVRDESLQHFVDWGPLEQPVECPGQEWIDLTKEFGLRFWVRVGADQTWLTLQVHHACTDGTGVYRFLGDLLASYGQQMASVDQHKPELAAVDPCLLRQRRARFIGAFQNRERMAFIRQGTLDACKILGARVAPLAPPRDAEAQPSPFPGIVSHEFSREDHKQLRDASARYGVMLNDLLLAELFRAVFSWNDQQGANSRRWLRIMMPSDLREQQDYPMPATNMTAYTFLARRAADCQHFETLIRTIWEETSKIKHRQLGKRFMDTLELASYAPAVRKFLLSRDRCRATVTLSNIGDPTRRFTATFARDAGRIISGNLALEDITGVPPLHNQMRATLAVFSCLRKLTLCLRCDPYRFALADSERFLQIYRSLLERHCEHG